MPVIVIEQPTPTLIKVAAASVIAGPQGPQGPQGPEGPPGPPGVGSDAHSEAIDFMAYYILAKT